MSEVQLPRFSTVNRWEEAATAAERSRLIASSRRKAQLSKIRTIAVTAGITLLVCALLNGAELMPAVQIHFWTH